VCRFDTLDAFAGTVFPAEDSTLASHPLIALRSPERTTPFAAERCRVLLTEPDADTRALYETAFAHAECEVIEAVDGRDALTKALVDPPTLIVSELWLPFIDAFALCAILRRDAATRAVPILIVTGDARPTALEHIRQLGADAVLVKPTTADVILSEAQRLIARGRDLREHATTARPRADAQGEPADDLTKRSGARRTALSKSRQRFTTLAPPTTPPALTCPSCDRSLKYDQSHVGGVSDRHAEQWDYFTCPTCGTFQYRQRTRKLRRVG